MAGARVLPWLVLALSVLALPRQGQSRLHTHLSFSPPFDKVNNYGERVVGDDWKSDGSAKVMKNFIRLTPDRQSKRGSLWSADLVDDETFSVILEFRISGSGERFFGDGLALWVVDPVFGAHNGHGRHHRHMGHNARWKARHGEAGDAEHDHDLDYDYYYDDDWGWDDHVYWPLGDYHGFVDKFQGFGVIFDTYINEGSAHRDVSVVLNDGTKTRPLLEEESVGCAANVRYYEGRGDFHAGEVSSRAKIEVEKNHLTVSIDARNTGEFLHCVDVELHLAAGWTEDAHLGVTSSTGQLADNHDIIRLETYVSKEAAEEGERKRKHKKKLQFEPDLNSGPADRMAKVETMLNAMLIKMELMEHQQEHKVASLDEHMTSLFSKTEENEAGLEHNLELLERKVVDLEYRMSGKMEKRLAQGLGIAADVAKGWRTPFIILAVLLIGLGLAGQRWYQQLRKSHLL